MKHVKHLCILLILLFFGTTPGYSGVPTNNPLYTFFQDELVKSPEGFTDLKANYPVKSDGSRSLGNPHAAFNDTRDKGSKIIFFDPENGANTTAEVYWWDGTNIIDSDGNTANNEGRVYGTDPLEPNEQAILPFKNLADAKGDDRLHTQQSNKNTYYNSGAAGGYPDWFLFKRGQEHTEFNLRSYGGKSAKEPMVVSSYGSKNLRRAIIKPTEIMVTDDNGHLQEVLVHPFATGSRTELDTDWVHIHFSSLEFRKKGIGVLKLPYKDSSGGDGPTTMIIEDCKIFNNTEGTGLSSLGKNAVIYRTNVSHIYRETAEHIQGAYPDGYEKKETYIDTIFYKNGFKTNPLTEAEPVYDGFSRNIYQGSAAQMGNEYRGIISAHGGSGGPQMRHGGLLENSLIIEGYWYVGTNSNGFLNPWLEASRQVGTSAVIRNNVQLALNIENKQAQPGYGFELHHASFGVNFTGNISSGALTLDELNDWENQEYNPYELSTYNPRLVAGVSFNFLFGVEKFGANDEIFYNQRNNRIHDNIFHRVNYILFQFAKDEYKKPIPLSEVIGTKNLRFENNVFVTGTKSGIFSIRDEVKAADFNSSQIAVTNNRFYTDIQPSTEQPWIFGNTVRPQSTVRTVENWPDPDRTLKRYVQEVLDITIMDWADDPYVDQTQKDEQIASDKPYDPTGMKTFMAVALNMRNGGVDPIPTSGKPDPMADYPWDDRFTAKSVVNWIRAGFNLEPVDEVVNCGDISGDKDVDLEDLILGLQFLVNKDIDPNPSADCNLNGLIELSDVLNVMNQIK